MVSVPSNQYFKNANASKTAQLTPLKTESYEKAKADLMLFEENRRKRTEKLDPIPVGGNDSKKYYWEIF